MHLATPDSSTATNGLRVCQPAFDVVGDWVDDIVEFMVLVDVRGNHRAHRDDAQAGVAGGL